MITRRWLAVGLGLAAVMLLTLFAAGPEPRGTAAVGGEPGGAVPVADPFPETTSTVTPATATPATTTATPTSTSSTSPPTTTTATPAEAGSDSCRLAGEHDPEGDTAVVPGETRGGRGTVWDVRIEIEAGLSIDGECFADAVIGILNDDRGWGRTGELTFRRADGDRWDVKLVLASPDLVDLLCAPINTGGEFSCRNGDVVAINLDRWEHGARPFGDDILTYRQYLVNHEVGHRLGYVHVACPAPEEPAPVMMQQSKSTGACHRNGWPLDSEL